MNFKLFAIILRVYVGAVDWELVVGWVTAPIWAVDHGIRFAVGRGEKFHVGEAHDAIQ